MSERPKTRTYKGTVDNWEALSLEKAPRPCGVHFMADYDDEKRKGSRRQATLTIEVPEKQD